MKKQDEKPPHLFPGDSPASPFPAPGNNGDLRTNGIYGPKCSALSGNCTPLGCLEKMLLASSIWGSTRRFLTWSRQATPLGFSYFLLSPSAHGMSAKELSSSAILLPTPLASDTGDVGKTVDVRMTPTGSFRKYNPSGTVWTARLSWAVYKLGSPLPFKSFQYTEINHLRNFSLKRFPAVDHVLYHFHTFKVGVVDVLDDGFATRQTEIIGQMMEEENKLLWTLVRIIVRLSVGTIVLLCIPGAELCAGGIVSCASDMARYALFQLGDGTWEGTRLISREKPEYDAHAPDDRKPVFLVF